MTFRNRKSSEASSGLSGHQEVVASSERPLGRRVSRLIGAAANRLITLRGSNIKSDRRKTGTKEVIGRGEAQRSLLSTSELREVLQEAFENGEAEHAVFAANVLTGRGHTDSALVAEELITIAGNAHANSRTARIATDIVRRNGTHLESVSPALTRWVNMNGVPDSPTLAEVAASVATYIEGLTLEKIVNWSPETVDRAHIATYSAGGSEWITMQQQARDLLNSKYAGMLNYLVTRKYTAIANGEAPASLPISS